LGGLKLVVLFLFGGQDDGCVYLVLEFCAGGNLASYIRSHGRVQQQTARKFMHQLGNFYLHFWFVEVLHLMAYNMN